MKPHEVWTDIVLPEEYDLHMANVGQAQANAEIIHHFLTTLKPSPEDRVVMVGAGTGQFLDYLPEVQQVKGLDLTFTDISLRFLETLQERAKLHGINDTEVMVDNIEATALIGPIDLAILVLVLEHVDWKLALRNLRNLPTRQLAMVTQINPVGMFTNASPHRVLPPSLVEGSKYSNSHLIPTKDLNRELKWLGYRQTQMIHKQVPDQKTMRGAVYELIS